MNNTEGEAHSEETKESDPSQPHPVFIFLIDSHSSDLQSTEAEEREVKGEI